MKNVTTATRVRLIGRRDELAALEDLLERVARGAGGIAVVEGEPGIGKTRLVEELAARAAEAGYDVFSAKAAQLERERPFGVIADALAIHANHGDPRRAAAAELLLSSPTGVGDLRFRVLEEILGLLEAAAQPRPVLLVLEDFHWADPSSVMTVARLVESLRFISIAVVITTRPVPRAHELRSLLDSLSERGALHVRLGPLDEADTKELVAHVTGAEPAPELLERVTGAAGNPLFIRVVVAAFEASATDSEPPASLRAAVMRQIRSMSDAAVDALQLASILGESFSVDELAVVAERPPVELLPMVREATEGGFVRDDGDELRFRHDVVREALYYELPTAMRNALHLEAARSLAAAGRPATKVAAHFSLGATPGDDEAVEWLVRAAEEVASRAASIAAELLLKALDLLPDDDPRREQLTVLLMYPLMTSGQIDEGERRGRELLARTKDPRLAGIVRSQLFTVFWTQNRLPEAGDLFQSGLDDPDLPAELRGELLLQEAARRAWSGNLDAGLKLVEEILETAEHAESSFGRFGGWQLRAIVAGARCRRSEAVRHARRVIDVAGAAKHEATGRSPEYLQAHGAVWLAMALLYADEFEEARARARDALRLFEAIGVIAHIGQCHWVLANIHFAEADWDDALADIEASRLVSEEAAGGPIGLFVPAPSVSIKLERGDVRGARDELGWLEAAPGRPETSMGSYWLALARAQTFAAEGRGADAAAQLRGFVDFHDRFDTRPDPRFVDPLLLRAASDAGEPGLARLLVTRCEEAAADSGVASVHAAARLLRGVLVDDPDQLLEAVTEYEGTPRAFELARAREVTGSLIATRDRSTAVALLEQAADIYAEAGATNALARARKELRGLGVRQGARGRRVRATSGWDSLTPSELQVVDLVTDGLTNREIGERLFVSRRTVETHLAKCFRKLEVSSRAQLAAEAARQLR